MFAQYLVRRAINGFVVVLLATSIHDESIAEDVSAGCETRPRGGIPNLDVISG